MIGDEGAADLEDVTALIAEGGRLSVSVSKELAVSSAILLLYSSKCIFLPGNCCKALGLDILV